MQLFADFFAQGEVRARSMGRSSDLRAGRIRCAGVAGAPAAANQRATMRGLNSTTEWLFAEQGRRLNVNATR